MSYDIAFKVKVEGADVYVDVGNCDANITWNLRQMIVKSTGLEWKNEDNNGYCVDIIPHIERGLAELSLALINTVSLLTSGSLMVSRK